MGKIMEKRKKKKKGRPSLLDLQKRTLKEQQQRQQQQSQNPNISKSKNSTLNSSHNYKSATQSLRRSTRRNPTSSKEEEEGRDEDDEEEEEEEDDAVELLINGKKRREKKLKLVLKLPSTSSSPPPPQNSQADSDSNGSQEDKKTMSLNRKRKINAIGDGSIREKGDNRTVSGANPTNTVQDLGPSTPLPDEKLLLFILERLQKKDTYGVFSEPVDPDELPDYHEVIEHPMDFGTVRKKLAGGVYANLEQFEKDVFLICSNAMQYNAPDTIYFRQARSIQELAKKNFENLRQDSDDNEPEPEPTVVRRGRPPTKNLKKPVGRPSLDRAGSEYSLDAATLATGGESTIWSNNDHRKGPLVSDKSGFTDSLGRSHGPRSDANWLTDNKFERNEEATGSVLKGNSIKYGKRQFGLDENRRNTYKQLSAGREPSVLITFDSERKQLMAVGLLSEHGYARSLARFAANVGAVAWKIASTRIERSLPPGIKFGPGWVSENDISPQRAFVLSSPPPGLPLLLQPLSLPVNTAATTSIAESRENLSQKPENNMIEDEKQLASEGHISNALSPSASSSTSPVAAGKPESCAERGEAVERLNSHGGATLLNCSASMIRPNPPLQINSVHRGMNRFNGTYGFDLPAEMGKLVGTSMPAGFNFQSPQMIDKILKSNTNFVHPATANSLNSEGPKLSEHSSSINPTGALPNPGNDMEVPRYELEPRPSWQGSLHLPKSDAGLSPQQKSDSVPPDLNVRFQSPGSPSSNRVDSAQPDLALQL
ncbi:bromodomain-containing protein [Ricinus communis]|uniref:Bromodomain-containing protein n=1 Tax=Ricinus communis TaxID=3988 RepID=B9S4L0_RICCO|nr:bromodomain-containing protein [Ricinus communis]|eukprot:XP_002520929.1 bromodomain-containing protein 9 [Ricinus communis]